MSDVPEYCEWFAACQHVATKTRPHPILGDVPICARCDTKITAIDERRAS